MLVEFVLRSPDLRQAMSQLKSNRGRFKDTDFVDIVVSEEAATFRAVGTETEVAANVKLPGSVRVPLRIVDKIGQIAPTLKKKDLAFLCEPGMISIGTWSVKHPDIEIGATPEKRLEIPIDLSAIDTLAVAEILGPSRTATEGMRARVEDAVKARTEASQAALESLEPLGITKRQLQTFIDGVINDAAERLRPNLERE